MASPSELSSLALSPLPSAVPLPGWVSEGYEEEKKDEEKKEKEKKGSTSSMSFTSPKEKKEEALRERTSTSLSSMFAGFSSSSSPMGLKPPSDNHYHQNKKTKKGPHHPEEVQDHKNDDDEAEGEEGHQKESWRDNPLNTSFPITSSASTVYSYGSLAPFNASKTVKGSMRLSLSISEAEEAQEATPTASHPLEFRIPHTSGGSEGDGGESFLAASSSSGPTKKQTPTTTEPSRAAPDDHEEDEAEVYRVWKAELEKKLRTAVDARMGTTMKK